MHQVVRRFGALSSEQTPCGKPLPMAYAHALMILRVTPALSQFDLAAQLHIDKSNVARVCARMLTAGHIARRRDSGDARRVIITLTARGKRLADEVETASHERFDRLLKAVPKKARSNVLRGLSLLVAALTESPSTSEMESK
jgi:DNA-binding MarR family transcriptional regulator